MEASTGVGVLVGIYPQKEAAEKVHPPDVLHLAQGGEEQPRRADRDPRSALHVYKATRHLQKLLPFLGGGELLEDASMAMYYFNTWTEQHWLVDTGDDHAKPPQHPLTKGVVQPTLEGDGAWKRTTTTTSPTTRRHRDRTRRSFTSLSSLTLKTRGLVVVRTLWRLWGVARIGSQLGEPGTEEPLQPPSPVAQ